MKIRNRILTFLLLIKSFYSFSCSCIPKKIINAYSNLNFIGIVEFQTLNPIQNNENIYESTFLIKELFKGNKNEKIYINSMLGSSCGFLPDLKSEYLILGVKKKDGKTMISYCLAQGNPNKESLSILRKLNREKIEQNITSNLLQIVKKEINYNLFEKSVKGIFLYKVHLNSELKIKEIIPQNENAKKNFNEKIRNEFKNKIHYQKSEEEIKLKTEKLTSYIILNWEENYENERIITTSRL
ncbi:hypothetical protein [uncultured Polaribacter sp.]|uniref:hypothetical protein n=1 Tax=uncultured Polaribacter sp. TaxID=174711 RepID=UPI002624DABC|nr:hypothetical protein [uncultured Polaribacter sp.]